MANAKVASGRRFAVVGAGPSGLYAVERILRADPEAHVDVFERLCTPYGLVRYGVAPDHQGTKAVARVLERTLSKPGVRFFGGVDVPADLPLEAICNAYDAVMLAIGVGRDRRLGIPGEDLPNVLGSWDFVAWLNSRPARARADIDLSSVRDVVIVGLGNVAVDVARVLLKPRDAFCGSDLGADVAHALAEAPVASVTIVGRGGVEAARFGHGELNELVSLADLSCEVTPPVVPEHEGFTAEVLRNVGGTGARTLSFRFEARPVAIEGDTRATGLRVETGGRQVVLAADLIVTCVGYDCAPFCDLPQRDGRFVSQDNQVAERLWAVGWAATGPRGAIADSRVAAHAAADRMLAATVPRGAPGLTPVGAVGFEGWRRIDAAEVAAADPDRCRAKFSTTEAMRNVAQGEEWDAGHLASADHNGSARTA